MVKVKVMVWHRDLKSEGKTWTGQVVDEFEVKDGDKVELLFGDDKY